MYWPRFFEHLPPLAITKWQCNIFHWLCLSNCNDSVQVRAVWQAPWMMKEVKLSLVIHPQGSLMYFNSKPYTGEKNKETKMKCRISFWFPHQRCQQVISISEKRMYLSSFLESALLMVFLWRPLCIVINLRQKREVSDVCSLM